jgi:hypothetical protein
MTAVLGVTPILNVSDIRLSIKWFEQMGWRELWVWRDEDAGPTRSRVSPPSARVTPRSSSAAARRARVASGGRGSPATTQPRECG